MGLVEHWQIVLVFGFADGDCSGGGWEDGCAGVTASAFLFWQLDIVSIAFDALVSVSMSPRESC